MMKAENKRTSIEKLLRAGETVQITPSGWSMYPLFVNGRDQAIIEPVRGKKALGKLKRGDVVLYRRDEHPSQERLFPRQNNPIQGGILVLHRIWKRKGNSFYLVGDNQSEVEGPVRADQIRGRMVGMVRNGKSITTKNLLYQLYAALWLQMRPLRPFISESVAAIKRRLPIRK